MREEGTCFITEGILQVEQSPFQEINTLEMNGQVNEHGSLWIDGKVPESKETQLTFLILNRTEIVLKTTQEMVLFQGILKELDVEYSDGQIIVDVKVRRYRKRGAHQEELKEGSIRLQSSLQEKIITYWLRAADRIYIRTFWNFRFHYYQ